MPITNHQNTCLDNYDEGLKKTLSLIESLSYSPEILDLVKHTRREVANIQDAFLMLSDQQEPSVVKSMETIRNDAINDLQDFFLGSKLISELCSSEILCERHNHELGVKLPSAIYFTLEEARYLKLIEGKISVEGLPEGIYFRNGNFEVESGRIKIVYPKTHANSKSAEIIFSIDPEVLITPTRQMKIRKRLHYMDYSNLG